MFSSAWIAFLCLVSVVSASDSHHGDVSTVKVNPKTHGFVDTAGRHRIFHGMNAVFKVAPWHPNTSGFDAENSLSDIDAAQLNAWGFNIVRLGVMWPGVEPTKGAYNATYLDEIDTIVKHLEAKNIHVILDFHQDLFHREFCGEGVPDYVYDACLANEASNVPPFPLPAVNHTYPDDETGVPDLDSCLSVGFATYYLSAETGSHFQCLYDNKAGLWDSFGAYWQEVAKKFSKSKNVIGYELINEPWIGDVNAEPKRFLPGYAEKNSLQPMYQFLHDKIREIDDEKVIFFEPLTIDYWPSGFETTPGGSEYDDRQALAYHIYCPFHDPSIPAAGACDLINTELFTMRIKDAERLGGGLVMTEFGASKDVTYDLYGLNYLAEKMDKYSQSWMYWQYKYYSDITTCTPEGEALYLTNGTVCEDKLRILSRTYPMAIAGNVLSYGFHVGSGMFDMSYQPWVTGTPSATDSLCPYSRTTTVYYNQKLHYEYGINVNVTITNLDGVELELPKGIALNVNCQDNQYIHLVHSAVTSGLDLGLDDVVVNVKATPCKSERSCSCRVSDLL